MSILFLQSGVQPMALYSYGRNIYDDCEDHPSADLSVHYTIGTTFYLYSTLDSSNHR